MKLSDPDYLDDVNRGDMTGVEETIAAMKAASAGMRNVDAQANADYIASFPQRTEATQPAAEAPAPVTGPNITRRQIDAILNDAEAVRELAEAGVDLSGTASQRRQAVRDYMSRRIYREAAVEEQMPGELDSQDYLKIADSTSENTLENTQQQGYTDAKESNVRNSLKGYWYPNLTKSELKNLRQQVRVDIKTSQNNINGRANWYLTWIDGQPVFAIYSTADASDPTILYAERGAQAEYEKRFIKSYEEEYADGFVGDGEGLNTWTKAYGRKSGRGSVYRSNATNAKNEAGDAGLDGGASGRKPSAALINCLDNILKVRESDRGTPKSLKPSQEGGETVSRSLKADPEYYLETESNYAPVSRFATETQNIPRNNPTPIPNTPIPQNPAQGNSGGTMGFVASPELVEMAGDKDMIKESHTRLIARSIPNGQLCILPGSHFVAHENPQAFNQAVLHFLEE